MEDVNKPNAGLTESDVRNRVLSELAESMQLAAPENLRQALAEEELWQKSDQRLKHVPEEIFVRDILPAVSGQLGNVDMVWWRHHFGSVTVGFFVVNRDDKVIFEFPPLAPSPNINGSKEAPPVGYTAEKFRRSVHLGAAEATDRLKADLRPQLAPQDGFTEFVENIAKVERICKRYGVTIVDKSKPEFQAIIAAAVEGLDEVLGTLGVYGKSEPNLKALPGTAPGANDQKEGEPGDTAYDDDAQASEASFD